MTTVGYGDRVPKSVPGRLLSVFWILCGMTICALLTAALTTAITTVAAKQIPTINKGKIGLLKDRVFEKSILMKGNADKVYRDTVSELTKEVATDTIEGILLDIYTAKFYAKQINKDLYVDSFIKDYDQSYLGLTVYDSELYELISEYIEFQKDYIKDFIFDTFRSMEQVEEPVIAANLIFTTKSGMFTQILYTCLVIFGLSLLIGGIYELYQYFKQKGLKRKRTLNNFTLKSLKTEESKLQEELTLKMKEWDKHLLSLMSSYTIEGMFKKSSSTFPDIIIKVSPYKREKDYTADDVVIEEQAEEAGTVFSSTLKKPKKKLPRTKRKSKVQPLHQEDGGQDFTNGYTRLKDIEDGKKRQQPTLRSKLKKTPNNAKKKNLNKTASKAAAEKRLDPQNGNVYGTYQEPIHLPNTARLPPLDGKIEDLV